jgi:hypothetical protein
MLVPLIILLLVLGGCGAYYGQGRWGRGGGAGLLGALLLVLFLAYMLGLLH